MLPEPSELRSDNHLQRVVSYTSWANETWIRFLSDHRIDDQEMLRKMSHILHSEQVWFQRIDGQTPMSEIWNVLSIATLLKLTDQNRQAYESLLRSDTQRVISYQRFSGERFRSSVTDILLHLVFHGAHHRGQLAMIASATGAKPVNTDYIQFCRLHDS